MCRIDAAYADRSLDEKTHPTERFHQALDESEICGHLRSQLTKHFSENWKRIFGSEADLENALTSAKQETSAPNKCVAILSSRPLARKLNMELRMRHPNVSQHTGVSDQVSELFVFAQDVAQTYFSDSPYSLFSVLRKLSTTSSLTLTYDWFVTALYGEELCFSHSLFDDPALIAEEESTRNDLLWGFFNTMSQYDDGNKKGLATLCDIHIRNLIAVASLQFHEGPPTLGSHKFLQGIRFLKAWIASDAEAGRLGSAYEGVFHKLDFEWSLFHSTLRSISSSNCDLQEASGIADAWLGNAKNKFWETLYLNMDLTPSDDHKVEQWASQLDGYFESLSTRKPDVWKQSPEEREAAENDHLKLICSQLTDYQIESWIQWTISKDIASMRQQPEQTLLTWGFCGDKSGKWWSSAYPNIWKAKLEEELRSLSIEAKLSVLSGALNRLPNEAAVVEYRAWWDGLLEKLIRDPDFPTALTPQWAVAAAGRLDNEIVVPYIDKSLGLLRNELSNGAQSHKQLEELLSKLSFFKPPKALRHRLMLMRSSAIPLADESLSRHPMYSEEAISWYRSLKDVARDRFAKIINPRTSVSQEEYELAEMECYETFALELVEFFLSRLRLRKGEKPKDGKYNASQVTEKSPVWRQGYLKALLELGLDPNGKAHKTVYFTKQFDPDESVRAVAKECYRAVRREAKKNRSIQDFKRGLIAAEWWLLMSQRLELNFDVNHEEALKTRRNLLRNP